MGFGRFADLPGEQISERSAAAFSPVVKEWSYGGASRPASMLSRTVMQTSRLCGCSPLDNDAPGAFDQRARTLMAAIPVDH